MREEKRGRERIIEEEGVILSHRSSFTVHPFTVHRSPLILSSPYRGTEGVRLQLNLTFAWQTTSPGVSSVTFLRTSMSISFSLTG